MIKGYYSGIVLCLFYSDWQALVQRYWFKLQKVKIISIENLDQHYFPHPYDPTNHSAHNLSQQPLAPLPDFQVSNVIAKNQPIEAPDIEERPLDQFFNRMNQLGYEANNVSQTFVIQSWSPEGEEQKAVGQERARQGQNFDNNYSSAPPLESRFTIDQRFRSQIKKRVDKIDLLVSNLNFQKFQIIDCLREFQSQIAVFLTQAQQAIQAKLQALSQDYHSKVNSLEERLSHYIQRCNQLQQSRKFENEQVHHISNSLQQLQEANKQLNDQLDHIELENSELKYQLHQSQIVEKTIQQLEEEIAALNRTIDQNCEYIFDLQQKLAGANLELEQREATLRKTLEQAAQEERERMQAEYRAQFQHIQQQIQKKIEEDLEEEYEASLNKREERHKAEIQDLRKKYEEQIKKLEQEKIDLVKMNRQYESRLHETEQHQLKKNTPPPAIQQVNISRQLQLSRMTNESLERQLHQKERQLQYYRNLSAKTPHTSPYNHAIPNILVIDQHNQSNASMAREAISPSSSLGVLYNKQPYSSRDEKINNILSRIRMRNNGSILSNLNDISMSGQLGRKGLNQSSFRPISPQSVLLERQKDVRMRNISHKLQQLRSDIRKQIGLISH